MAEPKHRKKSDSPSLSEMALCARNFGRGCSFVCPRTVTETSKSFRGSREPAGRCARRVLLSAFVMAALVSCPGASNVVPMGGGRGRASAMETPGGSGGGMGPDGRMRLPQLRHASARPECGNAVGAQPPTRPQSGSKFYPCFRPVRLYSGSHIW
jgi:hypothetical protein